MENDHRSWICSSELNTWNEVLYLEIRDLLNECRKRFWVGWDVFNIADRVIRWEKTKIYCDSIDEILKSGLSLRYKKILSKLKKYFELMPEIVWHIEKISTLNECFTFLDDYKEIGFNINVLTACLDKACSWSDCIKVLEYEEFKVISLDIIIYNLCLEKACNKETLSEIKSLASI